MLAGALLGGIEDFDETQTVHPFIEFLEFAALEHIPPGVIG